MANRVVITASGVISPIGSTPDEINHFLKEKSPCFERLSFDEDISACSVSDFNLKDFTGRYKDARYLSRGAKLAVAAAMLAVKNAGLDNELLKGAGIFTGAGPNLDISGESMTINNDGIVDEGLSALWILKFLPNTIASAIAKLTGIHGENMTSGSACAASLTALGEAYRKIKDGYLDIALAGGGDSRLSPGGILAYKKAQALWVKKGNPEKEYVPFGVKRAGFIPGEGGAFFILESLESAKKRNANILGEICGYSSSIDGYNMTAPLPDGKWAEKAVRSALKEAGLQPGEIDLISAHGTGTVLNDEMEARLINRVFSKKPPHVIALKSWIGHLASSCGAVELGICLACLASGYWPEIRNLETTCNENVNFIKTPRSFLPESVLLENFGFGGQNSTLVLKRWND